MCGTGDGCAILRLHACHAAPGILGISCCHLGIGIHKGDHIPLQILLEVVGGILVDDTAHAVLVVVQRDQLVRMIVFLPGLQQDAGSFQLIGVGHAVYRLAGPDAVGIVGIGIVVIGLQLSALFPGQGVA